MRLTVVGSQEEAEIVCGLIRSAGIECAHRNVDAPSAVGGTSMWAEVLVHERDLEAARELLGDADEPEPSQ